MGLLIEVKEKSVGIQFCTFIFMYKNCSKDSKNYMVEMESQFWTKCIFQFREKDVHVRYTYA